MVGRAGNWAYKTGVMQKTATKERAQLIKELFPMGVPVLWCPLLTHYDAEGRIDGARMMRHVGHLLVNQ
jgi:hypothetical protein